MHCRSWSLKGLQLLSKRLNDKVNSFDRKNRENLNEDNREKHSNRSMMINISKKLLGLVIALVVIIGLVSVGTWALFSDTETSNGNVINAGTLDLVPLVTGSYSAVSPYTYTVTAGGNGINGNVVFDNVAPGQAGSIEWVLSNSGSIPGTLTISSTCIFSENGSNEPEAATPGNDHNGNGTGDMDNNLMVTLQKGIGTDQASAESAFSYINGSTPWAVGGLQAILNAQSQLISQNGGNDTVVYKLSWSISSSVGNIIQSDTVQINITFTLTQ
jgi:spore coat-associated protein N